MENFNIFKKTDKDAYILWMTVFTSRNCFCISNPKIKKPKENFPLQLWYIRFILVLIWAFIHIIHSSLDNINSTPSILQLRWHRSRSLTNDSHLPLDCLRIWKFEFKKLAIAFSCQKSWFWRDVIPIFARDWVSDLRYLVKECL